MELARGSAYMAAVAIVYARVEGTSCLVGISYLGALRMGFSSPWTACLALSVIGR